MDERRKQILDTVAGLLKRYSNPGKFRTATLDDSTRLAEDLGVNSARMVDIVLEVEEQFNIRIDDDDIERTTTLGSLLDLLEAKTSLHSDTAA